MVNGQLHALVALPPAKERPIIDRLWLDGLRSWSGRFWKRDKSLYFIGNRTTISWLCSWSLVVMNCTFAFSLDVYVLRSVHEVKTYFVDITAVKQTYTLRTGPTWGYVCPTHGVQSALATNVIVTKVLWTKWHWDRILSEYFGFSPLVSFQQCPICQYHWRYILFAIDCR